MGLCVITALPRRPEYYCGIIARGRRRRSRLDLPTHHLLLGRTCVR